MEDFPIWLKMVIWLVVGGTVAFGADFTALLSCDALHEWRSYIRRAAI